MRRIRFTKFALLTVLSAGTVVISQQPPALPYESPGACPFECCTYRTWTVEQDTSLLADRRDRAPVKFRVRRGERVVGVTGVVVTSRFGRAAARSARRVGRQGKTAEPGDELRLIHYLGEGYWKYWFRDTVDEDFVPDAENCGRSTKSSAEMRDACAVQIDEKPNTTWWVKIRRADGLEGWTTQVDHFGNIDACGLPTPK